MLDLVDSTYIWSSVTGVIFLKHTTKQQAIDFSCPDMHHTITEL
jgi:hypothetical protein